MSSTRWCLCRRAPFRRDSSPYFCLTLIGYHCQVRKGEVNGGVESTKGHGCMMANLIASLSARSYEAVAIRWDGLDAELLCVCPCAGCVCAFHLILIGRSDVPAPRMPSP